MYVHSIIIIAINDVMRCRNVDPINELPDHQADNFCQEPLFNYASNNDN